jgi:quinol monooxygenase YgiN
MIIVLGTVLVREGQRAEALALSQAHVARSRAEPGCLLHGVHQDTENPDRLVFVEQWADAAALRTHFDLPASRAFGKAIAALALATPPLSIYEATPVRP